MSEQTDHERYTEAVSLGGRGGMQRVQFTGDPTAERIASLAAERDAYFAALTAKQRDVDALLTENAKLQREVAAAQGEARKWRRAFSGEEEA